MASVYGKIPTRNGTQTNFDYLPITVTLRNGVEAEIDLYSENDFEKTYEMFQLSKSVCSSLDSCMCVQCCTLNLYFLLPLALVYDYTRTHHCCYASQAKCSLSFLLPYCFIP